MKQSQSNNQEDIAQAKIDLQYLQAQQLLPPQIKYKLKYLEAIIDKLHPSDSITEQVSQNQRISLQQMPRDTQISIFISTIKCLSGKQIVVYLVNQKAHLHKQKTFFKWQKCYINCTSNTLQLTKDTKKGEIIRQFQIQKLFISKGFKTYKKKSIFGIYSDSVKYIIGFDEQKTCQRVHSIIYKLVKQKKDYTYSKFSKQDQKVVNSFGLQNKKVQELLNGQEIEFLENIKQKINTFSIGAEQSFKLIKNIQCGRIMQDAQTGNLKISLIVKSTDPAMICQKYLKMTLWNKEINTFKVVSKLRINSYICYLKTNKYSYLSYPRECYLSVIFYAAQPSNESSNVKTFYLIISSVEWHQKQESGAILMDFNQLLQIQIDYGKSLTLISISTKANFKGYCSASDNSAMLLHLFNDIPKFAQGLTKIDETKWFQFILQLPDRGMDINQSQKDLSLPTDRYSITQEQFQFNQSSKSQTNSKIVHYKKQNTPKQIILADKAIINLIFNYLKGEKDENIITVIKNKSYYSYYLKHKFSMMNEDIFQTDLPINKGFLLQNNRWKIQNGEYIFIDKQILANQKDVIKMILKQLGQNLMSGKSIMNMSLPVEIFDKRSLLDAIADGLGFLPYYLEKIKLNEDLVEQMKLVASAFAFIHFTNANIQKPFNPILGQTFQGTVGNIPVYLQQISHHPPISSLYVKTEDVQIYGNWDIELSMGLNSGVSKINSFIHVNFFSKERQYVIKYGDIQFGGLMYGNRTWKLLEKTFIYQKTNNYFCQISFGKCKKKVYESAHKIKPADLSGGIFKVTEQFGQRFLAMNHQKSFSGLKPEDIIKPCSFIEGKFYGDIIFDNLVYKSTTQGPFPHRLFKNQYLLPSDSLFRQDVVYRRWQQYDNSNSQKEKLQNLQRMDRKLRQKFENSIKNT